MNNLFEHTSAPWIRYSSYEYKTATNNNLYITVSKNAKPEMYHPMLEAEQLVIDAVNVGLAAMHKAPEKELKEAFVASRKGNAFCSQKYKNQFNVYKSREKEKVNKRDD